MTKKASNRLSEKEIARRREQAKAREQNTPGKWNKDFGDMGGKAKQTLVKGRSFRHQGR